MFNRGVSGGSLIARRAAQDQSFGGVLRQNTKEAQ